MRDLGLAWLCLLLLGSCDVVLPQGAFRCAKDRDCPSGWSCRSDRFCYSGDDSISSASKPDAAVDVASDATTTEAGPGSNEADSSLDASHPNAGDDSATPNEIDASTPADAGATHDAAADGGENEPEPAPSEPPPSEPPPPEPPPPEPAVDLPCSPNGAKTCLGHASFDKLVCQAGHWTIIGVCDGNYRCNTKPGPSQGSCQPIAPLCLGKNPNDPVCDGVVRKRCDADLLGYEPFACPEYAQCVSDPMSGVTCVDVNDCPAGNPCAPGTCNDLINDYSCTCPSGFLPNGHTCANIDDCPPDVCQPGGCTDGVNDYSCFCPEPCFVSTGHQCQFTSSCI
ncbi:MAG TPA: calcium-binding EGF-like domain-containing protein [Polyangiales bacterium]|nr:calcium-binding EGF-like domain-containing protein [Polyangiales bacterium]